MSGFDFLKEHPLVLTIGLIALTLTVYEKTIGSYRTAEIDSLTGKVKILQNAEKSLKSQLNTSIQLGDVEKITQQAALMVTEIYNRNNYSGYEILPKTYKNQGTIHTDFYLLESRVHFSSGSYTIEEAYESSKFVDAVTTFILTMNTIHEQNKLSENYNYDALFEGGADKNINKRKFVGRYDGEYGIIRAKNVLVNGRNKTIELYPNDRLGNSELAFLRSYSVYVAYRKLAKKLPGDVSTGKIKFIANESDSTGREYRYGKVTVSVKEES